MSLSTLEITRRACVEALDRLKRERFTDGAKLTLVARVPGVDGSHIVVTSDDVDEVIEVLRKSADEEGTGR